MQDFRKSKVWEVAHRLASDVHPAARGYPREEFYGLTTPSRSSVGSVPTNVAEGRGRGGTKDFLRFLGIAF
ncbi:MAG: four helix bundle protein, partial [Phycisphaerae bacterium]